MSRYKYYFRKPKSAIVKDILSFLLISGTVVIAANSPYLWINLWKRFLLGKEIFPKKRTAYDTFYNLKRQGLINIEKRNHQIYISLTSKGKKKAGIFQIDSFKIKKLKRWDKKWRLVIFDIPDMKRFQRNAFRGKLKELGFYPLQESVWVCPFPCSDEIKLLREFFGLTQREIRLITAENIEKDAFLREFFKLQ